MATITGKTAAAIQAIDDALIDSANISPAGHFQLIRKDAGIIDAGPVGVPPGSIMMYGGSVVPPGWLLCDGQAVLRSANADLFAAIGTTYGGGDGSTTFNVPNMEARLPRMQASALGAAFAGSGHVHSVSSANHDHNLEGGSAVAHSRVQIAAVAAPNVEMQRISVPAWNATIGADGSPTSTVTDSCSYGAPVIGRTANGSTGGGNTGSTTPPLPPYLNLNFIIKI